MPEVRMGEFERMRNGGARTSVRVQPTGTAVAGYQVPLGNRPSLRDIGVVGAPAWGAEQTETWTRTSISATCPRRLVTFEGGKKDIDRCMEFGDDFDGAALNTVKWSNQGSATVTVSGGTVQVQTPDNSYREIASTQSFETNTVMRTKFRGSSTVNGANPTFPSAGFRNDCANPTEMSLFYYYVGTGNNVIWMQSRHLGQPTNIQLYSSVDTAYHIFEIVRNAGTSAIGRIDSTTVTSNTNISTTVMPAVILVYGNSNDAIADWLVVRKYTPNEPVAGTAQPSALNRSMCRSLNLADGLRACCA